MRQTVKLGEILEFIRNGKSCKQNKERVGDKITRIETISDGTINESKVGFFELSNEDKEKYKIKKGDILFSHINSVEHIGKIAIAEKDYDDLYHGMNLLLLRCNQSSIYPKFLYVVLNNYFLKGYWEKVCQKAINQASLNQGKIVDIEIPLPPLETQKAIVAKLDQIFAELDQTKSEIQKNLDNTDELWKSALNQAFQGDWEMKKLGEVCEASIGLTYKPENVTDTGIIVLRSSNIKDRELDFDDIVRVNIDVKEELKVKEGDILMCARNGSKRLVGKSALIKSLNEEMTYGTFMMIIRSKYNKYLQYFFESDRFFGQIRTDNGPMINQITKYMIVDVVAPIPPLSEQEKIVEHLDQVSKEVKALKSQYQSQLDNLEELKKSVLDKAFRGELGE